MGLLMTVVLLPLRNEMQYHSFIRVGLSFCLDCCWWKLDPQTIFRRPLIDISVGGI